MELTEEQRQRMEENRAKAQARLREKKRARPSSAVEEGGEAAETETARPPAAAEPARTGTPSGGTSTRAGGGGGGSGNGRSDGRGRGAEEATAAAAVCEGCAGAEGDERLDNELLEGFGITVCRGCKLKDEGYQCVTKKEAKDTYLLPEGTIAVLKFIERDNPRHSSWTKMKLYLRRDVAAYSYKRWGSEDGLEEERNRRDSLKFDRSLSRTKGMFKRSRSEPEEDGGAL